MEKSNRPTGGVALYNIERDRFLPPNIYNHYYTYKLKISGKKYDQEKLENPAASLRTMVHRMFIAPTSCSHFSPSGVALTWL